MTTSPSSSQGCPSVAVIVPDRGEHGLARYAAVVETALADRGVDVDRFDVEPGDLRALARAVLASRRCHVLFVQYTEDYWGQGPGELLAAALIRVLRGRRRLVVTAHDFHTPPARHPGTARGQWCRLRRALSSRTLTARTLLGTADLVIACSRRELEVLAWTRPRRAAAIPHYVERWSGPSRSVAHLRESGALVRLVVLGWIHRRKGQHWGVRVLPLLPDAELVLAGGVNEQNRPYLEEVVREAGELGVADRLRCTGTLSDDALGAELAAAHVALAPYDRIAASGSIATLVAAGVPLVTRFHESLSDLIAACPTAVVAYREDEPASIAAAVRRCTAADRAQQRAELAAWAAANSPAATAQRHVEAFAALLG